MFTWFMDVLLQKAYYVVNLPTKRRIGAKSCFCKKMQVILLTDKHILREIDGVSLHWKLHNTEHGHFLLKNPKIYFCFMTLCITTYSRAMFWSHWQQHATLPRPSLRRIPRIATLQWAMVRVIQKNLLSSFCERPFLDRMIFMDAKLARYLKSLVKNSNFDA